MDGEAARRTAEQIGAVAGLHQDVREEASHRRVAEEAIRDGRLAAWCNNAGVCSDGELIELSSAEVEQLVQVDLTGERDCCASRRPRRRSTTAEWFFLWEGRRRIRARL